MRSIVFEGDTWERYEELRKREPSLHKVLCRQLREMQRDDPASGTGKPEPLKHALSGLWSRRLSLKDRLVYRFDDQRVYILAVPTPASRRKGSRSGSGVKHGLPVARSIQTCSVAPLTSSSPFRRTS